MPRPFVYVVLFVQAMLAQSLLGLQDANAAPRPNILLILADDLGYSDLGCYGSEINTPQLDALAAEGLRFRQFYNGARCCPTRASLLTGLYAHRAGMGSMNHENSAPGYQGGIHDQCVTLGDLLRSAGYGTYMTGKWHVIIEKEMYRHKENWPQQRGFDRFYGTLLGYGDFFKPASLVNGNRRVDLKTLPADFYYTDAISDKTIEYIDAHLQQHPDKPFFCYVSYTAPHWPLHAKREDIERYADTYSVGWDAIRANRLQRMKALGVIGPQAKLTERDSRVPAWDEVDSEQRALSARKMAVYAAMIDSMDRGIGRIIEKLRDAGQFENTIVIFLSDNGGCPENGPFGWDRKEKSLDKLGGVESSSSYGFGWSNVSNTPFREHKHWTHEGGIRTPFIVSWPAGISATNEFRDQIGHVIDIMPTLMDLAGAVYPQSHNGKDIHPFQGVSLLPAFENRSLQRDFLFWEHETNCAVRQGKWKLVARQRDTPNDPWELYDMDSDPTELTNLADDHPDRVAAMAAAWQEWAQSNQVLPLQGRPKWFYESEVNRRKNRN